MKKLYILLGTVFGLALGIGGAVQAATTLFPYQGGTGTSTAPAYGQVLVGTSGGVYQLTATSSLGLTQNLSGYVPYTGATTNLDMTGLNITATQLTTGGALIMGVGSFEYNTGSIYSFRDVQQNYWNLNVDAITNDRNILVPDLAGTLCLTVTCEAPLTFNYPLSRSANAISTVATSSLGLTVSSFASPNISQWTNNSGYLTSLAGAASSTLLSDVNTFTNLITGSISGNAGTVTNGVYTTSFNGLFDNRLAATTSVKSITTLENLSILKAQVSDFGTYEAPLTFTYPLIRTVNALSFPATSTLYGTGTGGQVLMWSGSTPIWAATSTNALTATTLQTARTINGVSFNGSANIVVASTTLLGDVNTWTNTQGMSISGTAANVTTNANLTGVVTSVGNTTSYGSQSAGVLGNAATGNTAPMSTTTLYGAVGAGGTVLGIANGVPAWIATSTNALTVTTNANLTGVITSVGNATVYGTQNAGVLGVAANGSLTAPMSTTTLYGALGTPGMVLMSSNGVVGWFATSSSAGGVTAVTATAPIFSSGGATPNITWAGLATTSPLTGGHLLVSNGTAGVFGVATGTVSGTNGISVTAGRSAIGGALAIDCATAASGVTGCLTGASFDTFTAKESALTFNTPILRAANAISWVGLATTSQPASSNLLVSNGLSGVYGVATTSATCSSGITCAAHGVLTGGGAITLATINAGVLGAIANGSVPTSQATSTLYGTSIGGRVLGWDNNLGAITWVATSSSAGGVTAVTGTWPIISSGGNTPNITFGGLSTTSPLAVGAAVLYATGVNTMASAATTSVTCSGLVSCATFNVIGATPIAITSVWPWTLGLSTYSTTTNATTTPTWFRTSFYASSTISFPSVIDNLITINATTTNATSTGAFALTGIGTCTGGQALKPSLTGGLSCQAVTASAAAGGADTQFQFNDATAIGGAGGLTYQKATGKIGFSDTSYTSAWSFSTTTWPQMRVASTTGTIIFEASATSTAFDSASNLSAGVRFTIASTSNGGSNDQLFVEGRINTDNWNFYTCQGEWAHKNVQIITDTNGSVQSVTTGEPCTDFDYDESTNGVANFVSEIGRGYIRLNAGATGAAGATLTGDGMGMVFNNNFINSATNTPVMEVRARIGNVNLASTTQFIIGFTNRTSGGAGAAQFTSAPVQGCYFVASSTQANWRAVCTTSTATTTVNTTVASSTVVTGTGRLRDFRIEMSSVDTRFYITDATGPVASSTYPVATITTNIPIVVLAPQISLGVRSGAAAGQAPDFHINRIRLWLREVLW